MELELPAEEISDIDATDPASKEFRRLKREVGLLRIAVETLVDEPAKLVIPDYTDTLAEIRETMQQMANHYDNLCDTPALSVTPEQLAAKISAASSEARKVESQALQSAENSFVAITRELTGFVESARIADKQNKWMLGFGGLCFVSGAVVTWAITLM
jgi:hypothetical protein